MIEFAQWKAEMKMESNGRFVVTRKLSVKKREDQEASAVMVIALVMNGIVLQLESGGFHESESWVDKRGEYLECIEEGISPPPLDAWASLVPRWFERTIKRRST